jgi:hypothetical protein
MAASPFTVTHAFSLTQSPQPTSTIHPHGGLMAYAQKRPCRKAPRFRTFVENFVENFVESRPFLDRGCDKANQPLRGWAEGGSFDHSRLEKRVSQRFANCCAAGTSARVTWEVAAKEG